MKSNRFSLLILIQLVLAGSLMSQTTISLTFTAQTDGLHQPLDSIAVENLTQGGDTMLHYPDTLLVLDHGIGVSEPDRNQHEGLILYPSFPNPFTGRTTTRFYLAERDQVTIRVFNLLGSEVGVYQQALPEGEHTLMLYPGDERCYFLVVETPRHKKVQKLVSLGGGDAFRIVYSGSISVLSGSRLSISGFSWVPGDQLQFTGYATLTGSVQVSDTLADNPVASSSYTFQFIGLPAQPSPIQGDTIPCENATGLLYSVIQQTGATYTWTVPTGWNITSGQGTHEITVTAGTTAGVIVVIPSNITGQGTAQTLTVTTQVCMYPPGYVHCNPSNPTAIVDVHNPLTGKIWMNRNLGAFQVAASSTDTSSYGDLFQWGRFADGHQCRTSATTTTLSSTDQPGNGNFILATGSPNDWRSPQNTNLWQGANGVNNPCPTGYRLPTDAEFDAERLGWGSNDAAGAFSSPLKLTVTGYRDYSNGSLSAVNVFGNYWSSTIHGTSSRGLSFSLNALSVIETRASGYAIRCINDSTGSSYTIPTLTTDTISSITQSSAVSGGNITSDGGAAVTARGVCWSTSPNPSINDDTTSNGIGTGIFISNLTGLSSNTTYYVRAYATNIVGTAYGNQVNFTTSGSTPSTYPAGYVHCNPSNPTAVVDVTNPITGKIWMDRNLGASQVASSYVDTASYGDLHQWGRFADGHQCRASATTTTLSSTNQPGHGNFIIAPNSPYDWLSPQNDSLWVGTNGINNPCPIGYRVPSEAELNNERLSWITNNSSGAFASPLKLTVAGRRSNSSGSLDVVGTFGFYWSSTVSSVSSRNLYFTNSNSNMVSYNRAYGKSVRCIKGN